MNFARLYTSYTATGHPGRRWVVATLPALALTALLAACGGSSSAASTATTSTTTAGAASFAQYTQCLTSHGVPAGAVGQFGGRRRSTSSTTVPGAPTAPTGTRATIPAQYQAAVQACASLRPAAGFGGGGRLNSPQAAAYRNCLQIHGVTLPTTPSTTPGQIPPTGAGTGLGGAQFANNPNFAAARQACASLLPARTGSTTTTTVASGA